MINRLKRIYIVVHFVFIIILALILSAGYFNEINNLLIDRFHGFSPMSDQITVVAINDESIQDLGAWPWNRELHGKMITQLQKNEPRVIGFDLLFLEETQNDQFMSEAIQDSGAPIVLGSKIGDDRNIIQPVFEGQNVESGFVNIPTDLDSKIRRAQFSYEDQGGCHPSWTGRILLESFQSDFNSEKCGSEFQVNQSLRLPNVSLFTYSNERPTILSAKDVINGNFNEEDVENKIVLVGITSSDIKSDVSDTLTDIFGEQMPGVFIHAQIINSVLNGKIRNPVPYIFGISLTGIYLTFLFWLSQKFDEIRIDAIVLLISSAIFLILGIVAFELDYNWPIIQSLVLLFGHFGLSVTYKFFILQNDKRYLENAFGHYINPVVLQEIIHHPESLKLGGDTKFLSIMFTDIRGFTTLSENMTAPDLVSFLNEYLDVSSDIILRHNGTIDKYIGDAIMAFWNAPVLEPLHGSLSIRAGLEILDGLDEFNKKFPELPDLHIGIGINSGNAVVGNIGGSERFDYTVVGDNVNLASRIEGLTKYYGLSFLVSESTFQECKDLKDVSFRLIDMVKVKGKHKSVSLYEPRKQNTEFTNLKNKYENAFILYQKGNFTEALAIFKELSILDSASKVFEARTIELIKNPPLNWDGIWEWEKK